MKSCLIPQFRKQIKKMYSEWNQTDRKISGCLQTGEREWRCEDERGAEREGQEGLQGEVRELLEIMDIFIIWNVVNGFMGIYICQSL